MRSVARRNLEDSLDEYLNLVQEGETILVTEQDHVIAELVPPREARDDFAEGNGPLADAIRKGWITPPTVTSDAPPPRLPVAPLAEILREFERDREDR